MSAAPGPDCGRSYTLLSVLTAITGPKDVTGSPVNGEYSWTAGWAGEDGGGRCTFLGTEPEVRLTVIAITATSAAASEAAAARFGVHRFFMLLSPRSWFHSGRTRAHASRSPA